MTRNEDNAGTDTVVEVGLEGMPGPAILEPHSSFRYVGRLFKGLALVLLLLLLSEIGLGVYHDGWSSLGLLLLETAQLLVFAGLLWGAGDLAYLILETNHDVRASRVLLWQLNTLERLHLERLGTRVQPVEPDHPVPGDEGE